MSELAQKLESLNEILNYMNTFSGKKKREFTCWW